MFKNCGKLLTKEPNGQTVVNRSALYDPQMKSFGKLICDLSCQKQNCGGMYINYAKYSVISVPSIYNMYI